MNSIHYIAKMDLRFPVVHDSFISIFLNNRLLDAGEIIFDIDLNLLSPTLT